MIWLLVFSILLGILALCYCVHIDNKMFHLHNKTVHLDMCKRFRKIK